MKDEFIQPFINAAQKVMSAEAKLDISTGKVSLQQPTYTSKDLTIMVGVTGKVQGTILYGMDAATAIKLASEIHNTKHQQLDNVVISAVKEICNVITGLASVEIEKLGYFSKLTPPTTIAGSGVRISTFNLQRLLIPLQTLSGDIDISAVLVDKDLVPQRLAI